MAFASDTTRDLWVVRAIIFLLGSQSIFDCVPVCFSLCVLNDGFCFVLSLFLCMFACVVVFVVVLVVDASSLLLLQSLLPSAQLPVSAAAVSNTCAADEQYLQHASVARPCFCRKVAILITDPLSKTKPLATQKSLATAGLYLLSLLPVHCGCQSWHPSLLPPCAVAVSCARVS